ncbi:SDR family oxidoreductase [Nocardioides lianchengensis]|uniref:3-oxoacyl-[acyl-carrier protein] reductase n=1 Tax=Nocardioides lianchengensis TaxID=1045774 RepID=A0A1G6R867_9ACTN|nr:SDR family oxidoreductase [Nocardioides lianchengensis]NYG10327.1 3-oxoacyl-[acyl-carrier protein] reductase [Nocardioides lianchengensis]SDD00809.1 3-oxoacyl-[acyl-carrier protein] reductase [Nocardioides lianchengensis]
MTTPGVAIITGASRGLGAAIALRLAADGRPVAVNYLRGREGAEAVVARIRERGGVAEAYGADVVAEDGVTALVDEVTRTLGPVTAVVANATGPQPEVGIDDLTWQTHLDQLEFFVKSPTLLVRAALPSMRAAGGGRVVLIGSDLADRAAPLMSAYVAAKSAQVGLTKVWAKELGPDGITVNLVQPGWIPVERHAGIDSAAYEAEVPLRRMGTPEDVAAMVGHLVSDAGGFVTGQRITVNGGHVI